MEKVEPDNLDVKYGGFGRPSWQVRWEGGKLCWRRFEAEWTEVAEEEIQPETQQWLDFWEALDQSRVWDWNEVYYRAASRADQQQGSSDEEEKEADPDEVVSWSVAILLKDGRLIDSSGSNAVPGATRRSRRGRGQRRGRRPENKPDPVPSEETPATSETSDTPEKEKSDPSNVGIPADTFDQFLTAVRNLIGGREFADQNEDETPESLSTPFRTLTPKRKTPIDPFAEDELIATQKKTHKRSKKRSTSGKKRTMRRQEGGSESTSGKRKKKRRRSGGKSDTGEKVGAENSPTTGRRRRRRRKRSGNAPGGESKAPQGKKNTQQSAGQGTSGDAPAKKKRRRRRRRPGGGSGKSGDSGANKSS